MYIFMLNDDDPANFHKLKKEGQHYITKLYALYVCLSTEHSGMRAIH